MPRSGGFSGVLIENVYAHGINQMMVGSGTFVGHLRNNAFCFIIYECLQIGNVIYSLMGVFDAQNNSERCKTFKNY